MSSTLRLSIITVFLLATTALGLIAYNFNKQKEQVPVAQVAEKAPAPVSGYYVAAHPLPRGTLARDEDFTVHAMVSSDILPKGAILDTPDNKIGLRGSLVRNFLETGSTITSEDVLRPRERGFLASVLAPDSRAISINVDAASGVSGLIWPGDYVDVVLTQESTTAGEKKDPDQQHGTLSETVVQNVRIVAIDQEIVQAGPASNATAGKVAHTVSLQLTPEQVKKVTLAGQRGKLTLAVRSAVDRQDTVETDTTVTVYARNNGTKYSVKKEETSGTALSSDMSVGIEHHSAMAEPNLSTTVDVLGVPPLSASVANARNKIMKNTIKRDFEGNSRAVSSTEVQSAAMPTRSKRAPVPSEVPIVAFSAPGTSPVSSGAKGGIGEH